MWGATSGRLSGVAKSLSSAADTLFEPPDSPPPGKLEDQYKSRRWLGGEEEMRMRGWGVRQTHPPTFHSTPLPFPDCPLAPAGGRLLRPPDARHETTEGQYCRRGLAFFTADVDESLDKAPSSSGANAGASERFRLKSALASSPPSPFPPGPPPASPLSPTELVRLNCALISPGWRSGSLASRMSFCHREP